MASTTVPTIPDQEFGDRLRKAAQILSETDLDVLLINSNEAEFANVEVTTFDGLAVKFVRECGARVMIRGVRPLTDIAAEFTMMMANRQLDPDVETVFLMSDEEFSHVSSSLIKQIAPLSDDAMLARFIPREIVGDLQAKMNRSGQD